MVGDVVGGYVVKESLGSGRVGLLYLAVHVDTGHRAVVRRRLSDSDSADEFGVEAAQALRLTEPPRVERRTSRSGLKVLLAIVDDAAPGSGRTEHANTQLLPDVQRNRRQRPRVLFLLPFLLVGVAVGAWLVAPGAPPIAPEPAAVSTVEPIPPPPPVVAAEPLEAIAPSVVLLKKVTHASPGCEPGTDWKRNARGDLSELMNRAAPYEALTQWSSAEYEAIGIAIGAAVTTAECSAIQTRLRSFHRRVQAAEKP